MNKEIGNAISAAAVVNEKFRNGILGPNRVETVRGGFQGERFDLTPQDEEELSSMGEFENLPDFALKLIELQNQSED